MNFNKFIDEVKRTESVINSANIDMYAFQNILDVYIAAGTVLDYIKKGIFYNNYEKYDANYAELTERMNDSLLCFIESNHPDNENRKNNAEIKNYRLIHALLGSVTEAVEIAEHLRRYLQDGTVDRVGIGEEYSDLDYYKALAYDELKLDEEQMRINVINKLRVKFPEGFDEDLAANRNLDGERKELERNVT